MKNIKKDSLKNKIGESTMIKENIIIKTWRPIIKMPTSIQQI